MLMHHKHSIMMLMQRGVSCCGRASSLRSLRRHCHSPTLDTYPQIVFPHTDKFSIAEKQADAETVLELLTPSLSQERLERLEEVVRDRCYGVVPVVEGLYDMGNLAAVCRSADALGYGAVHCIMSKTDKYKKSQRSAAGADKWLDVKLWDGPEACLGGLKAAGYQVVVTYLDSNSVSIKEVDWTKPTAFVLGNERVGVSQEAVQLADVTAVVPMAGFVESFNISVAAALIMYEAQQQRLRASGRIGDLGPQQQQQLLAEFMLRGVKYSRLIMEELLSRPPPAHQRRFFRGGEPSVQADGTAPTSSSSGSSSTTTTTTSVAGVQEQQAWQQQQQQQECGNKADVRRGGVEQGHVKQPSGSDSRGAAAAA